MAMLVLTYQFKMACGSALPGPSLLGVFDTLKVDHPKVILIV